jgi:hypothetical protein
VELNHRHTDFQSVALPPELPTRQPKNKPEFTKTFANCNKNKPFFYFGVRANALKISGEMLKWAKKSV